MNKSANSYCVESPVINAGTHCLYPQPFPVEKEEVLYSVIPFFTFPELIPTCFASLAHLGIKPAHIIFTAQEGERLK